MKTKLFCLLGILLGVWFGVFPSQVSAHATPVGSFPQNEQILEATPQRVEISYSERVEPTVSIIRVFDIHGNRVDSHNSEVDSENPRLFHVSIPSELETGVYTVSWQLVSADDGHFSKGAFNFGIGQVETASLASTDQLQIQHLTTLPEALTIFIELLGQSLVIGVLALLALTISDKNKKIFSYTLLAGAGLIAIGSAAHIILKTFDLQQLLLTDFKPTFINYLETGVGFFTTLRLGLALLLVASLFLPQKLKPRWIQTFLIGAILLARAYISHAAASFFMPGLSVGVTFVHLFAKELWIGLILVAAILFSATKKTISKQSTQKLFRALRIATLGALFLGAVTGVYVIWLDLKSLTNIFTTEWGTRMMVLLLAALWLLLVRTSDWLLKRPLLMVESFIGICILFLTSYIIITTPPLTLESYTYQQSKSDQGVTVQLTPHFYNNKQLLFRVDGDPIEKPSLQLVQTDQNIGPLVIKPEQISANEFVLSTQTLAPPGRWEVTFTSATLNGQSISLPFSIDYPTDINQTSKDPQYREFNNLTVISLVGVVALVMAASISAYFFRHKITGKFTLAPLQLPLEVSACLFILVFSWFIYENLIVTQFEHQCKQDGNFWIQSTPLDNGQVTSANTVTGCTPDVGLYHFGNYDQYQYFNQVKPATAILNFPEKAAAETETEFQFSLYDDQQQPLSDLTIEHDRRLHLIVVGEDLETFDHIHSEDHPDFSAETVRQGRYPFSYSFPKAGRYTLLADYAVKSREQSDQFFVEVEGGDQLEPSTDDQLTTELTQTIGDYTIELKVPSSITLNKEQYLEYRFYKNGKPITDLQPYLAAPMHVAVLKSDLSTSFHTHGEIWPVGSSFFQGLVRSYVYFHSHFVPNAFGPKINVPVIFQKTGKYVIFSEVQHQDQVLVSRFIVEVTN